MAHRLDSLLAQWRRDPQAEWVLAVINSVQGSAYRKTGAMMLIHPLGPSLGVLSGGCLEADLRRQAQRALQEGRAIRRRYDAREETDASFQLGCGGVVDILLLPLHNSNQALDFDAMKQALERGESGFWCLTLPPEENSWVTADIQAHFIAKDQVPFPATDFPRPGQLTLDKQLLVVPVAPSPRLAIFGGGMDAIPLANMARQLEWQVTVIDPRTAYGRSCDFGGCHTHKFDADTLPQSLLKGLDLAVVMHHNLALDAAVLARLKDVNLKYLALLGPRHRGERVLALAGLKEADFLCPLSTPAGLPLGGDLPGDIALSIVAACQAALSGIRLQRESGS
ncbi:XdhC family protein [Shewanella sedimentimangrovi]|uniref:XdhC family protein n=1 Tax=Shewanella sedimentimangrovi TaxID=2814293 RepID=A0ABX7R1X2_9GAMM|nr:XdhC/CoxI family protein [Shewanella sedimentimangrovi]QSX37093.1 XdhC family protein [Shewanella sedimentimangrovi]